MTSDNVLRAVLTVWHRNNDDPVTLEMVMARDRSLAVATCRQIAMYILHSFSNKTTTSIGRFFRRDHSTVLHAAKAVEGRIQAGEEDAILVTQTVELLREMGEIERAAEAPNDATLMGLWKKERSRANDLHIELMEARAKLKEQRVKIAELRVKASEVESMKAKVKELHQANFSLLDQVGKVAVTSEKYAKPMKWTAEERRRLKSFRMKGETHSIR